jgi:hypothetical protein
MTTNEKNVQANCYPDKHFGAKRINQMRVEGSRYYCSDGCPGHDIVVCPGIGLGGRSVSDYSGNGGAGGNTAKISPPGAGGGSAPSKGSHCHTPIANL